MPKAPQWLEIPAGTQPARCRSCDQVVYWITTATGKKMPVSVEEFGAFAPTARDPGHGISHFADCPYANAHRRPR